MTAGSDNPVIRVEHEGRVYRWERRGSAWPGHTCFVVLRGAEVVLGDRYAQEGIERSYACQLHDLLEGAFDEPLRSQLGEDVRLEVLAEVRHALGLRPASTAATKPTEAKSAEAKPVAKPAEPAEAKSAAKPVAKPAEPKPTAPKPTAASAKPQPAAASAESSARVCVTLTACSAIDLPLVVALRAITRGPVGPRVAALQQLPAVLAADVPRAEGEAIAQRLQPLGATVELQPVAG
ncbi:MAG: hypothetical protein KDK70_25090 [Myxococcales bacterium]|nr:hypothetical protein [Myxococcales bacterium]